MKKQVTGEMGSIKDHKPEYLPATGVGGGNSEGRDNQPKDSDEKD